MTIEENVRWQRGWARIAGLMYWAVLVVDMAGMQLRGSALSAWLLLAGACLTAPLALGLYFAVKPGHLILAASALTLRLLEVVLEFISVSAKFPGFLQKLTFSGMGSAIERLAQWADSTNFAALVFTIGSTIFFYLFWKDRSIPRLLAGWGLFASVVAFLACGGHLLLPGFDSMSMTAWIPMLLAETSTGVWLLFKSVKVER